MSFDYFIFNSSKFDSFNKKLDSFNKKLRESSRWRLNLIILCAAQFIAMIGMSACVPFLPLYIRELGVTNLEDAQFWSGLIFAGPYVLSIAAVPFWGVLGDKYGRKLMVVRAIIGLAFAMTLMGFAVNVEELFLLRILQGGVSGFIAATLAFMSSNSPENRSGYAIGMLQSAQSAGNIFGPFFGGFLSDQSGFRFVFFIVGALCLLSGLIIIFLVKENKISIEKSNKDSVFKNLKFVWGRPTLRHILILVLMAQAGLFFVNPIFPFFIESLQAPAEYLSSITGLLIGTVGIFSILFSPFWGRRSDKKDYHKTIKNTSLICAVVVIIQYFMPSWIYLIPMRIILGIFFAAIVPTLFATLSKRAPMENRGGVMGFASSAMFAGMLMGYLLCGTVASNFGMIWCFFISGIILLFVNLMTDADKKYEIS